MINYEDVEEILLDKVCMESMATVNLNLEYLSADFPSMIDSLCVRNIPGRFSGVHWSIIPSATEILEAMHGSKLEIAVTPCGNADSPVGEFFAKPYIINESLEWLLVKLAQPAQQYYYYFQSQDDNLQKINCPAPKILPLETQFLGQQKAANLWIGSKGTVSRMHNDNYDNIYVQVSGTKRIYLMPPSSVVDAHEQMLKPATYDENMELIPDPDQDIGVLFPTYNPATDEPRPNLHVIDLYPGDILFLPALWYHQIEILSEDINVSLNYWYTPFDDERRWSSWNVSRQLSQLLKRDRV